MKNNKGKFNWIKYIVLIVCLLLIGASIYFVLKPSDEEIQAELLSILEKKANYYLLGSETVFDDYDNDDLLKYYFFAQGHIDAKIKTAESGVLIDYVEIDADVVYDYIKDTFNKEVIHEDYVINHCVDYNFELREGIYEDLALYKYDESSNTYIAQELVPDACRFVGFEPNTYGQDDYIFSYIPDITEIFDYEKNGNEYIITLINGFSGSLSAHIFYSSYNEYDGEIIAEGGYILDGELVEVNNSVNYFLLEYPQYAEYNEDLIDDSYSDSLKFYREVVDENYEGLYKHKFTFIKENGNYILKSYKQYK